jgi:hypothetical protein
MEDERFWSKVDASGDCWTWTAGISSTGYGVYRPIPERIVGAHRYAIEDLVGLIPDGLQVDHLCRNRACVNPDHLQVVDSRTNTLRGNSASARHARKTHCPKGHLYDDENTYVWVGDGHRRCRRCHIANAGRRKRVA